MVNDTMTVGQRLEALGATNSSTQEDEGWMANILRKVGFPQVVITCGMVYLEGRGAPADIHTVARMLLKLVLAK